MCDCTARSVRVAAPLLDRPPADRSRADRSRVIKDLTPVLADFEFPVIETYSQLAWVMLAVAGLVYAGRSIWRAFRPAPQPAISMQRGAPVRHRGLKPLTPDFEKLGGVIARTTDRVSTITENQQAATVKIDSTEMAVNRLMAELSAIMILPRAGAAKSDPAPLHAPLALALVPRPPMPLPECSERAA